MAFKNVYMTEEDKRRLLAADIPDPRCKRFRLGEEGRKSEYWTYDKESGHVLIGIGVVDRDAFGEFMYLFFWEKLDKEHMIKVILERGMPKKVNDEDEENGIEGYTTWELMNINTPSKVVSDKKKIFKKFIEAMGVFGIDGDPTDDFRIRAIIYDKGGLINE
jgi:hypothetical protein